MQEKGTKKVKEKDYGAYLRHQKEKKKKVQIKFNTTLDIRAI